jgi:hypothetical protein
LPKGLVLYDLVESLLPVLPGLKDQPRPFNPQLARFARKDGTYWIVSSAPDVGRYKRSNRIDIMFGHLDDWRRVATRYDRCAKVYL